MNKKYVITIMRQFGSMGRPIARMMSERLGIEYYDRDIVEETAKRLNMSVSELNELDEYSKSSYSRMRFPLGNASAYKQTKVFLTQSQIIMDLAEKASCIIVGRCTDFVLKQRKDMMNVYIYAPYDETLKNCIEKLSMDEDTARKMIHDVDKARDAYHMRFAKYLPGDPNHKDVMINSTFLGEEGTAEYLCELVRKKFI